MKRSSITNNLLTFWERKYLLKQMILSKLIASQKDLMLGYAWWVLEPLLLTLVYWLLVSVIFQRGGANYPLFILCGLVPYRAFAISFNQSVSAISSSFGLIGQINFPRFFLPISTVIANHVKLIFGFVVILTFCFLFNVKLTFNVFFIVLPFLAQILLTCGLALIMSILGVYFRDLKNLMQFVMRAVLYLSPILYSLERIPEQYHDIYMLNPIAALIVTYRNIMIYGNPPDVKLLMICYSEALLLICVGFIFFSLHDRKLLKYI
jgi:homopolymeric O-antigen transport system permease protein